eukprot:scaffold86940_cov63-Phaeocystis_antarctica.AAC.1
MPHIVLRMHRRTSYLHDVREGGRSVEVLDQPGFPWIGQCLHRHPKKGTLHRRLKEATQQVDQRFPGGHRPSRLEALKPAGGCG